MLGQDRDVLILDGDCGLCHRLALFINPRLIPDAKIEYRPFLSNDAQELIETFPKWQQGVDTVYLFRNGSSYIRSAAVIRCLLYMRWPWMIWFPIFWIIPLPIRNIFYRIVARYRHRIFKKPKVCAF